MVWRVIFKIFSEALFDENRHKPGKGQGDAYEKQLDIKIGTGESGNEILLMLGYFFSKCGRRFGDGKIFSYQGQRVGGVVGGGGG